MCLRWMMILILLLLTVPTATLLTEEQGAIHTIPELTENLLHCCHIGYAQTLQTHNISNILGTLTAKCEAK